MTRRTTIDNRYPLPSIAQEGGPRAAIPMFRGFGKRVGGQRGLAQGSPSHTIDSSLQSASFPMPPL